MKRTTRSIAYTLLLGGGLTIATALGSYAHAVPLISGMSGDRDYGTLAMERNDDGSSNSLALPFELNFYGNRFNDFFINNNGNITFGGGVSAFTPEAFPISSQPMIAPFWGDVDTGCQDCGEVYVGSPNEETVVVTWNNVGYYSQSADKTNNFQLALRKQGDNGDFDIEFRYDRLEWTTGGASGGTDGLGGTPAQAGFDAGNGSDYFTLPGSRTENVLDLQNNTNVTGGEPGFWSFAIRNGTTPGETPDNPLMPVVAEGSFTFDFGVEAGETVFVDPEVAIGYDFEVQSGPNFASVLLPSGIGDDRYEIWTYDQDGDLTQLAALDAGVVYNFAGTGVDFFRVLGIETGAAIDPDDFTAFVTGLTFVNSGQVSMSQTPLTVNTDPSVNVNEPASAVLLSLGVIGLYIRRRYSLR